jgi:glycosyltransferase involved in cell wall biosynthesis
MACGTAVIGVREGGVRETIVHEATGLLTGRDPQGFAEAVGRLMNDPDQLADLGRQGRTHVEEQWQWEGCVRRLEMLLASVAERSADS